MPIEKPPFPDTIPGERICLKRYEEKDAEPDYECIDRDRERLLQFLPWPQYVNSVEDELGFIRDSRKHFENFEAFDYRLCLLADNSFLGTITSFKIDLEDMHFELGYWLLAEAEGHGYMSEAVNLMVREHAARGFHRAEIQCQLENARSKALAERCGFTYEGTLRDYHWHGTKFVDAAVFARLLSEGLNA